MTRRNLERRLERQVVLDDGRVIEEGAPEVTVDEVEDEQTHEDSGGEEDNDARYTCRRFLLFFAILFYVSSGGARTVAST